MFHIFSQSIIEEKDLGENDQFSKLLKSLNLLKGDSQYISSLKLDPVHELALHVIYCNQTLDENIRQELKERVLSNLSGPADTQNFMTKLLEFALSSPYETHQELKKSYPAWFTEYMVFLWDINGRLTAENFIDFPEGARDVSTSVVEFTTSEYVNHLIEQQFENLLELCKPYLLIMDDESIVSAFSKLIQVDFKPHDTNNFNLYKQTLEMHIKKRENEQLMGQLEKILEERANYFARKQDANLSKENFHKALKHLSEKRSMRAFNAEVISKLDIVFKPEFHPNELLDEEMDQHRDWKEKSKPFLFLATLCELIRALKDTKNNTEIDRCISLIFTEIDVPFQHKIRTIQLISNEILNPDIKVNSDLIMKLIIEFEKFESRDTCITGKYFKEPIQSEERNLIRYALNQALTCGIIRG